MIKLSSGFVGWAGFIGSAFVTDLGLNDKPVPHMFKMDVEGIEHMFIFMDTIEDKLEGEVYGWVFRSIDRKLTFTIYND